MHNSFEDVCLRMGIEARGLIAGFHDADPRFQGCDPDVFKCSFYSYLKTSSDASVEDLAKILVEYFQNPDRRDFWKYALLTKYINSYADEANCSWEGIPNHWIELERYGGSVEKICSEIIQLNNRLGAGKISSDGYEEEILSALASFLAVGLAKKPDENIYRLLELVVSNKSIAGAEISRDVECDWGELAFCARRMLEEFTDVRIDAPVSANIEEDGYLDLVDWSDVANEIVRKLA